jgi:hypothetical protein
MAKKYFVTLPDDERAQLLALTTKGWLSARQLTRAHILLQADAGATDDTIARHSTSGQQRWNGSASALSQQG